MGIRGRHLQVLIGMCGLLASGVGLVTNVAGLFFTPVATEFDVLKGQASLMLTICNISLAIGGLAVPRLLSERTLRPLLIGATAVLAGSTAALSLCPNIMALYVLSAVRGLSAGLITFVFVTSVLNQWFVTNIGLATSIAMSCSGLAGAAFSPIIGGIIDSMGWRGGFVTLGILTVCLNLPAILFLPSLDPHMAGFMALGEQRPHKRSSGTTGSSARAGAANRIEPTIFAAVFLFALIISATTALPQHFPGLAEGYALAGVGATMISVSMVANSLGKIALGALVDRVGTRTSTLLFCGLVGVALVMLLVMRSPIALLIAAGCYGLCYALGTVALTMITRDAFGLANYSRTYPTINLAGNMANAVFSSVVGFMYDFSGSYTSTLILFLVMLAISVALVLFVYARRQA